MKHLSIKIYGKVQGVSFRKYVNEKAREFGLVGWTRNELDGTVLIEVEGDEQKLKKFLNWCYQGSPSARVDRLDYEWSDNLEKFEEFGTRYLV